MMEQTKVLFVLFGATGDLAFRKLYPAIFNLYKKNKLAENFALIGTGRREWSNEHFRQVIFDSVSDPENIELVEEFTEHFYYKSHDVNDREEYLTLNSLAEELDEKYQIGGNRLFYLSMTPDLFGVISKNLAKSKMTHTDGFSRIVFEKPFGFDLESAIKLDREISQYFNSNQIFRIDHYLGKEKLQNIIALRFANPLINKIWNKDFISNIQITLEEDMGVGDRGGYYDSSGALKDMVQNHIMQIFSILAMDEPASYDTDDVAQAKIDILKDLKPITKENIQQNVVRAQYVAKNEHETSYRDENQVDDQSTTDTFVAGRLELNNQRWEGVPFYYRTGKNMDAKVTRIDIVFKGIGDLIFDADQLVDNVLTISFEPNTGIYLTLNEKEIGLEMNLTSLGLYNERTQNQLDQTPEAYEKLMNDALLGMQKYFVHMEEVIESWKYIDSIYALWGESSEDLTTYPIGSNGPTEAEALLNQDGNSWVYTGKEN